MSNKKDREKGKDFTVDCGDDDGDTGNCMGRFIKFSEIRAITDKTDFRVMFDVKKVNGKFKVGKQTNTAFFVGGVDDVFHHAMTQDTFETYLEKNTSWNLYRTLKEMAHGEMLRVSNEKVIPVFIQDTFDIVKDLYHEAVKQYIEMSVPSSLQTYRDKLVSSNLSVEDQFVYFVKYLFECLNTTSNQLYLSLLEELFKKSRLSLKWFVDTLKEIDIDTNEITNRREQVQYTLKFHTNNIYDTYNLERYIKQFIKVEGLDRENFNTIARVIKGSKPKERLVALQAEKDLTFKVMLKKTKHYNQLQLKAFDLSPNTTTVIDYLYELRISNFIAGSPLEQTFRYINLTLKENVKEIEMDVFVQFEKAEELLYRNGFTREDTDEFLELLSRDETKYKEFELHGVIVEFKQLNRSKRCSLLKDGVTLMELEYRTKKQASPRCITVRNLAILKLPKKSMEDFDKECLSGLYPHQISFINSSLLMLFGKEVPQSGATSYDTIVCSSVVGSGKTIGTASLAFAMVNVSRMEPSLKRVLIYTTTSRGVLKEVFIKSKEIRLDTLSAFVNQNGNIVIKSASSFGTENNIPFEKIVEHDILICHPLTLLKLLSRNDNVLEKAVFVIDELNSDVINSDAEHTTGALLAYLAVRRANLCVLSASIQRDKHINYLSRYGKVKLVESSNILVPTIVRDFNSNSIDIVGNDLKKVLNNGFFRRFINPENVLLPQKYITMMKEKGVYDYAVMLELYSLYHSDKLVPPNVTPGDASMLKCINSLPHYTLVATREPQALAVEIYGDVFRKVEDILSSKVREIQMIQNNIKIVEDKLKEKEYKNNVVKDKLREKVRRIEETQRQLSMLRVDDEGVLLSTGGTFSSQIKKVQLLSKEHRFTSEERNTFLCLSNYTPLTERQEKVIEVLLSEDKLSEKDKENITCLKEQVLSQSEKLNLKLIGESDKLNDDRVSLLSTAEHVSDNISEEIETLLKRRKITHKFRPSVMLDEVLEWSKEKPQDYIWKLLGIFIERKKDDIAPQTKLNRLFAGKSFARGIDLAIEAVVITDTFATLSADDILQMTGRSGRPGKSKISIIYMEQTTYNKIFHSGTSKDVEQIVLRMNYYLQNQSQVDILELPVDDPNFTKRLDCLVENMKR